MEKSTSFRLTTGFTTDRRNNAWLNNLLKRTLDILVSLVGIVLLAPLILYIVWRIRRDAPGPIFYRGARAGRGGTIFYILKFRSMYDRPESFQGPRVTAQDDPRITPSGRWLRDTKLNELPQLWNVLKGEMSLVGPRPEDPEIVNTWPEDVQQEVLSVRPGVTSPASVIYRDEETLLSGDKVMETYLSDILPSKLRLDQLYVRHRSFWGDLDIIFWTLLVLIPRVRLYSPSEKRLFVGPIAQLMRHHVSWFIIDTVITFVSMGLAGLLWRSFGPLDVGWRVAVGLSIGFAVLFSITNAILGVNRIEWSRAAATDVIDLLPAACLATVVALLGNYFLAGLLDVPDTGRMTILGTRLLLPHGLILVAAMLSFLGYVLVRYRTRLVTGLATRWVAWRGPAAVTQERVLIVGGGEAGQFAAWMLNNGGYSDTLRVIGFVDDDLYKQGARIHGVNVLGQRADIPALVVGKDIGIIVFAIHNISADERRDLLDICGNTAARLVIFPNIFAALNGIALNNDRKPKTAARRGQELPDHASAAVDLLPCHLCLTKISPLKMDGWLAQLEQIASSGDLDNLQAQIRVYRKQMHGDVATQLAANLGWESD